MTRMPGPVVPATPSGRADRPRGAATSAHDGAGFAAALDSRLRRDVQPRTDDAAGGHQHPRTGAPRRPAPRTADREVPQRDTDTAAYSAQGPVDRDHSAPVSDAGAGSAAGTGRESVAGPQDTAAVAGAVEQVSAPGARATSAAPESGAPASVGTAPQAASPVGATAPGRSVTTPGPVAVPTAVAGGASVPPTGHLPADPAPASATVPTPVTDQGGPVDGPGSATADDTVGGPAGTAPPAPGAPGTAAAPDVSPAGVVAPDGAGAHHRAGSSHAGHVADVSGFVAADAAGTTATAGTSAAAAGPVPGSESAAPGLPAADPPVAPPTGQGVTTPEPTATAAGPQASQVPATVPTTPVPATTAAPVAPPVQAQVLAAVSPLLRGPDGSHRLTLQLAPEHLGRVRVEVTVSGAEVALHLVAADAGTRETLRHGLADLRAQLEQSGLRTTEVDVRLGSPDQGGAGGADLSRSDREPSARGGHGAVPGRASHGEPHGEHRTGAPAPRPATPDVLLDVRM